jgi:hypothetical protein
MGRFSWIIALAMGVPGKFFKFNYINSYCLQLVTKLLKSMECYNFSDSIKLATI